MADLPLLFVKILVNPKGLTAFCALIKTKSAHDKLQSIKNAWSKDEIWRLEMAALLTQGNSESDKYRFNTAFLTGSDYNRYPMLTRLPHTQKILFMFVILSVAKDLKQRKV